MCVHVPFSCLFFSSSNLFPQVGWASPSLRGARDDGEKVAWRVGQTKWVHVE